MFDVNITSKRSIFMKIIRNNKLVIIPIESVESGDIIICDNYEELVKISRDLSYAGIETRQKDPMEITIV